MGDKSSSLAQQPPLSGWRKGWVALQTSCLITSMHLRGEAHGRPFLYKKKGSLNEQSMGQIEAMRNVFNPAVISVPMLFILSVLLV
jgi:hypothetical protein